MKKIIFMSIVLSWSVVAATGLEEVLRHIQSENYAEALNCIPNNIKLSNTNDFLRLHIIKMRLAPNAQEHTDLIEKVNALLTRLSATSKGLMEMLLQLNEEKIAALKDKENMAWLTKVNGIIDPTNESKNIEEDWVFADGLGIYPED